MPKSNRMTAQERRYNELKQTIVTMMFKAIDERHLSQAAVAALLGTQQPHISALKRGTLNISLMRLMQVAERLGIEFDIVVKSKHKTPSKKPQKTEKKKAMRL